jgi:Leucine-rich repeat (LRR) protein
MSLEEAVENAQFCKKLWLLYPSSDLKPHGQLFLRLAKLKSLEVQCSIEFDDSTFSLPEEIGELTQLEKLTLLNVPLSSFPEWIGRLKNLKYLMVRGNDVTQIPPFIQNLTKLKTLRVENCELNRLPKELSRLAGLTELGLGDTKIPYFPIEYLPPKLKVLGLGGPIFRYDEHELRRVRKALPNTKVHSFMRLKEEMKNN